jgi:glycerol-3-phosphate acyltransferase PlsX
VDHTGKAVVIAVDAMGGDHGPSVVVPGVLSALQRNPSCAVALYGDEAAIKPHLLSESKENLAVTVVPCSQNISMGEAPATAIRSKPDSPIVKAMQDQAAGRVHAVVSAGSTGAMVAASLIILGRLASVDRPAIGTLVPTVSSHLLLLDAGANVQCTPEHLLSFATMGDVYAREILDLATPRVGLLNIGEEESKGNELTTSTFPLLKAASFEFIGNVESNHLLQGQADVVVTDGFTGNMVLKLLEGFGLYLAGLANSDRLPEDERKTLQPVLAILEKRFSYENYGGALLLGINGVSIISHGRSSSRAIANAVTTAVRQVAIGLPAKLHEVLG